VPTYEYRCEACGHELELFQPISEAPKKKCPACKRQKLKRKIGGGAGFLFKGSGFYLTDYRSDSYKRGAEAESKPAEASAPAKDGKGGTEKASASEPTSKPTPKPAPQPSIKSEPKPSKKKSR
jgi:putative FmdB family regulatory protein